MDIAGCHPLTYDITLTHPDDIMSFEPDELAPDRISSGWLMADALCHPDDIAGVGISSGWVTANSVCHPDDNPFHLMSSGWHNWGWYLTQRSYGNVIMPSGWDTLPFLSHPDEITHFHFSHQTVVLQRFRSWANWYFLVDHQRLWVLLVVPIT